ncbi:TAXI family TRAP transporter solute-binding subunit [Tibeticola sp.]|uniref:TAXI family TRAP transporter solute-binding subunit n=1 Tax=Tibeticola sp. TaxID=2005368 RepID=UPI0025DFFDAC|nr:TAXI family TRAP transporter solute-binding subunit [Tibeticola sp.]
MPLLRRPPKAPRGTSRNRLLPLREWLWSAAPVLLLALALLWGAYLWLNPVPPQRVTLATGPEQSAYAAFGERYARALAAEGITVTLLPSEGSRDNLRLLREGKADFAFVQGGSDPRASGNAAADDEALLSLGSLFVEPIWLFYREDAARRRSADGRLASLAELAGLRVNVGTEGSGVPALMAQLFALNHLEASQLTLSHLPQTPATVAFLDGTLDALVFASAPEAPMVQMLLQTPGVRLMDFAQSAAYARRLSFLTPVVLPRGVVDLAADVPPQDVRLVAVTTTLLAREDTHPALLQLFTLAARTLHGGAGWFNAAREYPNLAHTPWPVAREAERTLQGGAPLLQRYLPFAWANLVERMWLALGLILAIVLPLSRVLPPLYDLRIRSRVFRWYGRLRELEHAVAAGRTDAASAREALDALERQVQNIAVPLSHADALYALREHIRLVRSRL